MIAAPPTTPQPNGADALGATEGPAKLATPVLTAVAQAIRQLVPPGANLGVAVSGGPDSMVLLQALARLRPSLGLGRVWALAIDHGLRPAAAAEVQLVGRQAQQLGLPFASRRLQLPTVAGGGGGNLLEQARQARYDALAQMAAGRAISHIATAHSATDQAETMLHHACRGTGLAGLTGIASERPLTNHVILTRPLLAVSRDQVFGAAWAWGLTVAVDPSNQAPNRARARLRHRVLPQLRQLHPQADCAFSRLATRLQADQQALQAWASELRLRHTDAKGELNSAWLHPNGDGTSPPQAIVYRVLRQWLQSRRLPTDDHHVQAILALCGQHQRGYSLGWAVVRWRQASPHTTAASPDGTWYAVSARRRTVASSTAAK